MRVSPDLQQQILVQWFERSRYEPHLDGSVQHGWIGAELLAAPADGGDALPIDALERFGVLAEQRREAALLLTRDRQASLRGS